jgi:hypothetical protein
MISGNLKPFIDEILKYHESKALRSYREYNENAFHTAIEVLLRNFSIRYISELQIIAKYKKKRKIMRLLMVLQIFFYLIIVL